MASNAVQSERSDRRPRVDPGSVVERLFQEGYRFDFFQAAWLLENLFANAPAPGVGTDPTQERIRFRPHSALVFPASDVREVAWFDDASARVTVTFMGLYGVDAPLPVYFFNSIASEAEDGEVLRDFLDIFNHRLFTYFYRTWKKYRPGLHFDRTYRNVHAQTFVSLAGLGTGGAFEGAPIPALRLAAFAGRLADHTRNAEGLRALVADLLGNVQVGVLENVPRWVRLGTPSRLGSRAARPAVLGADMIVGRRLYDVSGKFRLTIGPLTYEQFLDLLPGGPLARTMHALVRLYAPDYLDFDVELLLDTREVPPLKLGDPRSRVGRNAWVGRPDGEVISETVAYA